MAPQFAPVPAQRVQHLKRFRLFSSSLGESLIGGRWPPFSFAVESGRFGRASQSVGVLGLA